MVDLVFIILFLVSFCVTSDSTLAGSGATSDSTLAGSGATSDSTLAGSGATSDSTLAGSGATSTCSAKNAELSADNGFVSAAGSGLVSVNAGFSSCMDSSGWGKSPKLSVLTLLLSILM